MPNNFPTDDRGYTSSDYGAGIGPGLSAGFGRRSTQNSSQTSMPSNPSPADSHGSRRVSFGPEKMKGKAPKRAPRKTKPVKVGLPHTASRTGLPKAKRK